MGEEIMSEWITIKATQENNRLKQIDEFKRASETFLAELKREADEALGDYYYKFPERRNERIEISHTGSVLEVVRLPRSGGIGLSIRAYCDPIGEAFIYEFPLSDRLSKRIPATANASGRSLSGKISTQDLLEAMLTPIFFPAIVDDPGVLRFLQQEFCPR
jgi:hypothetical protein